MKRIWYILPRWAQFSSQLAQLVRHWSPVQATQVRFLVGASNPGCPIVEKGSMYTAELMTFPASAPQLAYHVLCMCYYAYVVVHIKDPQSLFEKSRALCPGDMSGPEQH